MKTVFDKQINGERQQVPPCPAWRNTKFVNAKGEVKLFVPGIGEKPTKKRYNKHR